MRHSPVTRMESVICLRVFSEEESQLKQGFFRGQSPEDAKRRLVIFLVILGAVLILILCGVVAVLLTGQGRPGGPGSGGIAGSTSGNGPGGSDVSYTLRPQNGYINVVDCGADPSGSGDDTEAFRRAAASGLGIFVPAGEYRLSGTVELNGQDVVGEGLSLTRVCGTTEATLFRLTGSCRLTEMTLSYTDGTAGRGEKTAVRLAGAEGDRAPSVKNVRCTQVGTAVLLESGAANGVRIEDLTVDAFGYAGIVFDGAGSRGANLRSILLQNAASGAAYGIELQGDEGTLLEQITIKDSRLQQGICFSGSLGFRVKAAQFLGVQASALCGGRRSAGSVGSVYRQGSDGDTVAFEESVGGEIRAEYTAVR